MFRAEEVNLSPAFFDVKKLRAFNDYYIRAMPIEEFIAACQPWLRGEAAPWRPEACDEATFAAVVELAQTRISLLSEIVPIVDEAAWAKAMKDDAPTLLAAASQAYESVEWRAETLKSTLETVGAEYGPSSVRRRRRRRCGWRSPAGRLGCHCSSHWRSLGAERPWVVYKPPWTG